MFGLIDATGRYFKFSYRKDPPYSLTQDAGDASTWLSQYLAERAAVIIHETHPECRFSAVEIKAGE